MRAAVFIVCSDDRFSRFDRSTLSQQNLMERFVFGLDKADEICDSRDYSVKVCHWEGVTCNTDKGVGRFILFA